MSTINLRVGNDALTFAELDANFTNLNNDKYESGDSPDFLGITLTKAGDGLAKISSPAPAGGNDAQFIQFDESVSNAGFVWIAVSDDMDVGSSTDIFYVGDSNLTDWRFKVDGAGQVYTSTGSAATTNFVAQRIFADNYHPNADKWTSTINLTIGGTTRTIDGTTSRTWTLADIGVDAAGTINYTHPTPARTNNTSTQTATHGGTFTAIDSITSNANGHVTAVNTKTVTLPSDNNTDTLQSIATDATNVNQYISFVPNTSGAQTGRVDGGLLYNPSSNLLTASNMSTGSLLVSAAGEGLELKNGGDRTSNATLGGHTPNDTRLINLRDANPATDGALLVTSDTTATGDALNEILYISPTLFEFKGNGVVVDTRSVSAGTGLTGGGDLSANRTISLDYAGTNNYIDVSTSLEGTPIATADTIAYHDATDNNVKKGLISDLPFNNYTHPTHTARSITTTGVDVLSTFASNANGHVTGITTRTLPNASASVVGVVSTGTQTFAGAKTFSTGPVYIGVDDNTSGNLVIYGASAGDEGGELRLHTTATNDTTYDYYRIDVFQDDLRIGRQGQTDITLLGNGNVTFSGSISAVSKSFDIEHPTKDGKRLRYGSLEGPENGVYVRGKLTNNKVIELPDYWTGLVDEATITVSLTPIGSNVIMWVEKVEDNKVYIEAIPSIFECYYHVFAERKDIDKITVEYDA